MATAPDTSGFKIIVADSKDAYQWRTVASLAEPGMPADAWIGNACLMDHDHAAAVYAPRTFVNKPDVMQGGAFTAVVNLTTGTVKKLPFTASLAYFDPSCNSATHTAVFSAFRDDKTHLVTVTTAGKLTADATTIGQMTSAVPVKDGLVAALGHQLVHVDSSGRNVKDLAPQLTAHRSTSGPPGVARSRSSTTTEAPPAPGCGTGTGSSPKWRRASSATSPSHKAIPARCSSPATPPEPTASPAAESPASTRRPARTSPPSAVSS
ncbi:hypothetical protein AB0950_04785 [Streptomyces sp. NPDC007189]|uniref:hypothetical protein n=1 Tax=Streptomyces sp. NPDC007189 TaxID=3154315 RepID=UPI003455D687